MITIFQSIILGTVEGITEFLPISSTAHLILAADILGLAQSDYMKSFEIAIQSGAIVAVVWLYLKRFLEIELLKKLIVAFIPTGVVGIALYGIVKRYLLGNTAVVLWALFLGGILIVVIEQFVLKKRTEDRVSASQSSRSSAYAQANEFQADMKDIRYGQCLIVGIFQSIAIIPGVSRSAATIIGGMLAGIPRKTIVEFSFLLAVPTMFAATGLDILKSAGTWESEGVVALAVGFIVSFVMAVITIRWLLKFVSSHTFIWFGVYRLVVVSAFLMVA